MGSCMSKGKQKRKTKHQNHSHVDDDDDDEKLVISQASTSPSPFLANMAALLSPSKSPASITSTSSLSSSISCPSSDFSTASSSISSSSSSLSSSSSWSTSSVLISKERSFSNEFLRSCAKDNPHINIGLDPIRESSDKHSSMSKRSIDSSPRKRSVRRKQSISHQERPASSTPRKRSRNNSPMAVRQKSLRRELDERMMSSSNNLPSRAMRSPSPSRRFNTDSPKRVSTNATKESHYKNSMASKVKNVNHGVSSSVKRDLVKPTNSNHGLNRVNSSIKSNNSPIQQIDAKIAEIRVGEMEAKMDIDSILVEDINNPHIALDCFIFL